MIVLGIESSCDETAAALVNEKREILAETVLSQEEHKIYGGVVPELASRDHIRRALVLIDDVLSRANVQKEDIDAVAVTEGPGLAGALLVGSSVAHAIGYALGIPVVGVHHLEGHLLSACLADPAPQFPFIALLVSGGHTQFMRVNAFGSYELLGETLDDAAGEAFDKTAQLLGEGYPGGPAVSRLAESGMPGAIELPRPMLHSPSLDMSFSGLKTAVLTAVNDAKDPSSAPIWLWRLRKPWPKCSPPKPSKPSERQESNSWWWRAACPPIRRSEPALLKPAASAALTSSSRLSACVPITAP